MFRFSGANAKLPLTVQAAGKMTEIYVIDGDFNVAARGLGSVQADLLPGLYKIKYKAGGSVIEQHLVLDSPKNVQGPLIEFSSPAPIHGTATSHEYQAGPASQLSLQKHLSLGAGSMLFVFVREPDEKVLWDPAIGLSLHDSTGQLLADFQTTGNSNPAERWSGCNVECNPGIYRLRVNAADWGSLEQVVAASPGYQTQIFLTPREYGQGEKVRRPDLLNSAIYMRQVGEGYQPGRALERKSELARLGVKDGRPVMPKDDLRQMLNQKSIDPMLGIFAAHLLRLEASLDMALLQDVLLNLAALVPSHPDVMALRAWLEVSNGQRSLTQPLSEPPMLARSWALLNDPSVAASNPIASGSLADYAASRLWGDGVWLVWRNREWDLKPRV